MTAAEAVAVAVAVAVAAVAAVTTVAGVAVAVTVVAVTVAAAAAAGAGENTPKRNGSAPEARIIAGIEVVGPVCQVAHVLTAGQRRVQVDGRWEQGQMLARYGTRNGAG